MFLLLVVMLDVPTYSARLLATHSIRIFPLHFPYRASPCAIRFHRAILEGLFAKWRFRNSRQSTNIHSSNWPTDSLSEVSHYTLLVPAGTHAEITFNTPTVVKSTHTDLRETCLQNEHNNASPNFRRCDVQILMESWFCYYCPITERQEHEAQYYYLKCPLYSLCHGGFCIACPHHHHVPEGFGVFPVP